MNGADKARMSELTANEETENYVVIWDETSDLWELRGKFGDRTFFMNQCRYKTPLLVAMRKLEAAALEATQQQIDALYRRAGGKGGKENLVNAGRKFGNGGVAK